MSKKIVIIGGGPTGIGAAYKLAELKYENWVLFEKEETFGGLSGTIKDEKGFYWDFGGHVSFSHYNYYDNFVKKASDNRMYKHNRECWIKYLDRWVPYPFQNNIRYLDKGSQLNCVNGLLNLKKNKRDNFKEWVENVFGEGIAKKFMFPYNFKVWATPLTLMSADWIKERVSMVDTKRVIENIILEKDDLSWGPNNKFLFPKNGGTGYIFDRGARQIKGKVVGGMELIKIDSRNKLVYFSNGHKEEYDVLIITIPIKITIKLLADKIKLLIDNANKLVNNSVYVIGLGLKKQISTSKCWVYFPEKIDPFYRLTFFHNYSKNNVPNGDISKYSSLMCEVSYSKYKKVNKKSVINDCIQSLIRHTIIDKSDVSKIISKQIYNLPFAYPVPTIERDKALSSIQKYLMSKNIYSRGRFGAWKYEIGNMDHSFMQGVEVVDSILNNKKETIWS